MAIVTKTFTTTCYGDLRDAINANGSITPECWQIIDLGNGDCEFEFSSALSGGEDTALDGILSGWTCSVAAPTDVQPVTGYFNIGTSTGNVVETGVGFKPAYIIFNMNNDIESETSDDISPRNDSTEEGSYGWGQGFAVDNGSSIQQQSQFFYTSSNSVNAHRNFSDPINCIHLGSCNQNGDKLSEAIGAVTSFDSDGFTLNFTTNSMGAGYVMQYIAFPAVDTLVGPAGADGQGLIEVQNNDVSVSTEVANLNFEGSSVQSIVDEGSGKVTLTLQGGGGGEFTDPLPNVQARRTTGISVPLSWTDLTFDTTDVENDDTIVEHTISDRITVKEDGLYMLTYTMVCDDEVQTRIRKNDTTVIPGSTHQAGDPNDVNDVKANNTTTVFAELTANDFLSVQIQAATSAENLDAGAIFTVTKMQGAKGDKGDTGSGGTIEIQEDDATVNGSSDTLNFEGNVAVVNEGSGKTTVTITDSTPVFGSQFQNVADETLSTTNSTTWQQKLRMSTTNLPSGTYRISWYCELNSTNGATQVDCMIQLNDTTNIAFCSEEPDDLANIIPFSGFQHRTLSGVNTIDMDYRRQQSGHNVSIRYARIELWRVA